MSRQKETLIDITVVLRSYNDAALLPFTLKSLDDQRGVNISLYAFESASTDGSKEILEQHGYDRIEHLKPGTYHSSTVLNTGVEWSSTEFVAFINSDAILLSDDVLIKLAHALSKCSDCCGAFARQKARPNASVMTRLDYFAAFEHREELGDKSDYMSLVTSMIRRSCWEAIRFDPTLTYAEDYVWSERVKHAGYQLCYVKDAEVEHSHNYSNSDFYRRCYGDAAAISSLTGKPPPGDIIRGVLLPLCKRVMRDFYRLYRMGELSAVWKMLFYRWAGQLGQWRGSRDAWKQFQLDPLLKQPTVNRDIE
jgi:rhamnosyltransferase